MPTTMYGLFRRCDASFVRSLRVPEPTATGMDGRGRRKFSNSSTHSMSACTCGPKTKGACPSTPSRSRLDCTSRPAAGNVLPSAITIAVWPANSERKTLPVRWRMPGSASNSRVSRATRTARSMISRSCSKPIVTPLLLQSGSYDSVPNPKLDCRRLPGWAQQTAGACMASQSSYSGRRRSGPISPARAAKGARPEPCPHTSRSGVGCAAPW